MDNLSGVGTATKDYIAVVKGNYYGLIDYNGNWILKKSIYKDFADK